MEVQKVDLTGANAPELFTESLINTGFAVVGQHPIDMNLVDEVYAEWAEFFASDEKNQYEFDPQKQDGYFPYLSENAKDVEEKDLKEFYHLYSWGKYPKSLSDKTKKLFNDLNKLAALLLHWIDENTPEEIRKTFSMPLHKMIENSPQTMFRIINYPPLKGNEHPSSIRAAAHEDINLITLLPAATASGLQVQDVNDNWHEVPLDPGMIAVNAGDMLQECTNGYYKSTTHRVTNPEGEDRKTARLSMPLFLHPNSEVKLSQKYTAGTYLKERLEELGLI